MPVTESVKNLAVRDLGTMAYAEALELQREVNQRVAAGDGPPTLLLVEHEPVITLTPRKGVAEHLLASRERLAALGIDVQPTDRGGDITYHGPGQLVAYPIVRLAPLGLNLGRYMRLLEQVVMETVAAFGVEGVREPGATGVWVEGRLEAWGLRLEEENTRKPQASSPRPQAPSPKPRTAKLCAMGVRIRRNTTMHGLALNVAPDLSHFDTIVPCGLAGRPVTSLHTLLGQGCPSMDQVKAQLTGVMLAHIERLATEARS